MPDDTGHAPHFDDTGQLTAPRYGDCYFSKADGFAETAHVFLEGNRLTQRFKQLKPGEAFVIGETGFGTGLNFLACWQHFDEHAPPGATLHFFSVEKHPLPRDTTREALAPYRAVREVAYAFLEDYPPGMTGSHTQTFAGGRVTLTLHVGEAAEMLAECEVHADAWLLDGFAPARNPAMWSPEVFAQVARLSHPGTTLATYTAAGFVRRGLAAVGFAVEKRPGFGTKRDMTVGRMPVALGAGSAQNETREAVVIGAGVAGSFAARALADRGWRVVVLERQPTAGGQWPALRPRVAIVQPKINHAADPQGSFLRDGFTWVERMLRERWGDDPRIGWRPCGVFHAPTDERSAIRLDRFVEQFASTGLCRRIDADETRDELGAALDTGGVVVDRGGLLRPGGLCAVLLDHCGISVRPETEVVSLGHNGKSWQIETRRGGALSCRVVVVANAVDAKRLAPTAHLPLEAVRGQVSVIPSGMLPSESPLCRVLCFGGYMTPAVEGAHTLGASFVHDDTGADWRVSEHQALCDKLARLLPATAARVRSDPSSQTGWVGFRCTTPKRRPFVGALPANEVRGCEPGLYISLGHGSHGITSAAMSAQHVADAIESDATKNA